MRKKPSIAKTASPVAGAGEGLRCGEVSWDRVADCRHCAIRQQALFSALRGPDFEHIFQPIRSAVIGAGTELYREDGAADAVYTIRRGSVKLIKQSPGHDGRIVRLLGRGAALGLEALTHGLYWHSAVALRQVELCRIPLEVFLELRSRNVQLAERVVEQWETQLNCADRWLAELNVGTVAERVHRLLALLTELEGGEAHRIELPPMTDIASILGTSRESVSRTLAGLKRGPALRRVAPHTYECNLEALSC